jgi:ankyrin repeat protein
MSSLRFTSAFLTFIAFASATLAQTLAIGRFAHPDFERNDPVASQVIADQFLTGLSSLPGWRLVERSEIDRVLSEHALSLDALAQADAAARFGRLVSAELILVGTLSGAGNEPPAITLEVVESTRAETVAQVRVPLRRALLRGQLAPLDPKDLEDAVAATKPLLEQAWSKTRPYANQVLLQLLALPNRSGDRAWDGFAGRFEQCLAEAAESAAAAQKIVRNHRPDVAIPENELRLLGLVESDPEAWKYLADYYVLGAIEKTPEGAQLKIRYWDGENSVRELAYHLQGDPTASHEIAVRAAAELLAATRGPVRAGRSSQTGFEHRKQLASLLLAEARQSADTVFKVTRFPNDDDRAVYLAALAEAKRLAAAAIFMDPTKQPSWSLLESMRAAEARWALRNRSAVLYAEALIFGLSVRAKFILGPNGRLNTELIPSDHDRHLSFTVFNDEVAFTQENYADIYQGRLILRLRDRVERVFIQRMREIADSLERANPSQDESYVRGASFVLRNTIEAGLDPRLSADFVARLLPRARVAACKAEAWGSPLPEARALESLVRDFYFKQGRGNVARQAFELTPEELAAALSEQPPRLVMRSATRRLRAEIHLHDRSATPLDPKESVPRLLEARPESRLPSLDDYPPSARTKHASRLLASYADAEAKGYPPVMVSRLKATVEAWSRKAPLDSSLPPSDQRGRRIIDFERIPPVALDLFAIESRLADEAQKGDLHEIAALVEAGAPIEACGKAFVSAIEGHHWPIVEYILGKGYDPSAPWPSAINPLSMRVSQTYGVAALLAALRLGRLPLADRILAYGVRFATPKEETWQVIVDMTQCGDTPGLLRLKAAEAFASIGNDSGWPHYSMLAPVVARRDLPALEILLQAGLDPDSRAGLISRSIPGVLLSAPSSNASSQDFSDNLPPSPLRQAVRDGWKEGVEAMLRAPATDLDEASRAWLHLEAADPELRASLLEISLRNQIASDTPSASAGIALARAIAADDADAVRIAWRNPAARKFRPKDGQCPLAFAICEGRPTIARLLLDLGAPVNELDEAGVTPLAHAAALGDVELLRLIAAKGADLNLRRGEGNSPLGYAIYARKPESALALLDLGASISIPPGSSQPDPLFQAVLVNWEPIVDRMLRLGADPLAIRNGMNILFPAARSNNPQLIERLVRLGCDPSYRNTDGWTPLVTAVRWGAAESVVKLLELGVTDPLAADAIVSITSESNSRYRPRGVDLRALPYKPDFRLCLELLQEHSRLASSAPAKNRIFWRDFLGRPEAEVAAFLNSGGDVNFRGEQTPLQQAADHFGYDSDLKLAAKWVGFLLAHGANPNATGTQNGLTPLRIAVCRGNIEAVRALLAAKADSNAALPYNPNQINPSSILGDALRYPDCPPEVVRLLLDHGAVIDDEAVNAFSDATKSSFAKSSPERLARIRSLLNPDELRRLGAAPGEDPRP